MAESPPTASAPELDVAAREALAELLLGAADDEFVIGFWDSEWTGIAPMLEEDVATSSIAQDEIGHAKALYEMLAELTGNDADAIAYGRDADAWLRRLSEGDGEGRDRFSAALVSLWADAQEVFAPLAAEEELVRSGLLTEPMRAMHAAWQTQVRPILEPICGELPRHTPSLDGRTRRTDDFRWLHAEFTSVHRSEAGAQW